MSAIEWSKSQLDNVSMSDFSARIAAAVASAPSGYRAPEVISRSLREMPPEVQYFWFEMAESVLTSAEIQDAIIFLIDRCDRRYAIHVLIELLLETPAATSQAAADALTKCVHSASPNDPLESLSRQALEALWFIDRSLAIRVAEDEQNFSARPNLAFTLSELHQDDQEIANEG